MAALGLGGNFFHRLFGSVQETTTDFLSATASEPLRPPIARRGRRR